jgi:O-antigen/teichoic acid export membrane protein
MHKAKKRILRWLDTDISYLARGGGWTGASQGVGLLLSLATSYVFANYLTQTEYGTYKYVLAAATFFAIPALSGMNTAVLQAVAQGHDGTVRAALSRRLIWGVLGMVGGALVSTYYFLQGDMLLGVSFLIAAVCAPVIESLSVTQALLLGKKRFDVAAVQGAVSSLFTALAVIAAVLITYNPLWVIAAYFGSTLIARIAASLTANKFVENNSISKESLSFGVHTSIAGVLAIVANSADVFIVWHTAGAEQLAMYAFALAAVVPFQTLVKTGINLAHPKFAAQEAAALVQSTRRRARQMFLLLIPVVLAAVLALPILFSLLFPAYMDAVPFAQVLAISVLFYSEKLYGIALTVSRKSKALYYISTVSAVSRIVFLVVLIPVFGVWGAVAATLLQQCAAFITTRMFFYTMEREILQKRS